MQERGRSGTATLGPARIEPKADRTQISQVLQPRAACYPLGPGRAPPQHWIPRLTQSQESSWLDFRSNMLRLSTVLFKRRSRQPSQPRSQLTS